MGKQILKDLEQAKKAQPKAVQHPKPQPNFVDKWLNKEQDRATQERRAHIAGMKKGVRK
jgi:hypothetical protein